MNYSSYQIEQIHNIIAWICSQAKFPIPECSWNASAPECANQNCRETLDLSTVVYFRTVPCNRAIICPQCLEVCCTDRAGIPLHLMRHAPPTQEEIIAWEKDQAKAREEKEKRVSEFKEEEAQEEERKREVQEWMERVYRLMARYPSHDWKNGPPPVLDFPK